ncbi:MAG: deoxyguanosinetriphosphate triphosphohydrolase [Lachnospiraceae bacterium]|nr:deoxyguanosinetriphosphate triphosphohydrolase [Lachnospiraceae bacterium]
MTIREKTEEWECRFLSPYAARSRDSRGRALDEPPCEIRPVYQRDRDRILHCKSFRRLKHKTQVFLAPKGDHYRTRLTHTLEVSQVARTIARALRLNEDLTEAIALGHDLGHTPFGHAGERVLNQVCSEGFAHYIQSVRVVEKLEKEGRGLNLSWEVRDGIRQHQMDGHAATLEGRVVRLADKIAYIHHDVDDAIRGGIIREEDIPEMYRVTLGRSGRERLNTMVCDIITTSLDQPDIRMSDEVDAAFRGIRRFMFENVYTNPVAKAEEKKAENIVSELFHYYMERPELLSNEYIERMWKAGETQERSVCDYISGMTDQFAIDKFREFFVPEAWRY